MELTPTFIEEPSRVVVSYGSTFNLQVRMVDWGGAGWHNRPTHLLKGSECKFALTRIHRWTRMDDVRTVEGG